MNIYLSVPESWHNKIVEAISRLTKYTNKYEGHTYMLKEADINDSGHKIILYLEQILEEKVPCQLCRMFGFKI